MKGLAGHGEKGKKRGRKECRKVGVCRRRRVERRRRLIIPYAKQMPQTVTV